ncbi:MAG: ATP-binding cassette domain-containing protein [Oscillospiraceae bacterium]|nr:ATP-binding cassette domain-containing protein [Oscillospiraceae bacterium]
MEICKLEHIHKDYRMGEVVTPLKDITLTVHEGDFIAVEGPSGIGKSTLLYVMGTLLKADEGSYVYGGQDVAQWNDAEKSAFRAKKIGFLFQDSTMIQALTLRENLIFTQRVGARKDLKKVDELLYQFGLEDRADFFPHQLSGGQRRRAMAARALIHEPELILADEPTNDLDEHWSREIIRILKEQTKKGTAVVMVTHNSRWAGQATRRLRLEDGILTDIAE